MFKRILIATDGSPLSHQAVAHGVALAKSLGASVVGFHNRIPFSTIYYGEQLIFPPSTESQYDRETQKLSEKYLGEIEAHTSRAGVDYKGVDSSMPSTSEEIIRVAEKNECDLIIMASHGRKGIARIMLGSEANLVLTHSTIPVLITR